MLDIGTDKALGQHWSSQTFEVDGEKGDFRSDIDEAKALVEFDAVDNLQMFRFEINMLGAEVSMAIADTALLHA